jgi:hypothetical protein
MKTKNLILIGFSFLFVSCSFYEPTETTENELIATSIKFIDESDGLEIQVGECLSPNAQYAIQIETENMNNTNSAVTMIQYTVNGILYGLSFTEAGIRNNTIKLVEGSNYAQLVKNGFTKEIVYTLQDDFVLVD